jgi:hypothetical protein
MRRIIVVSVIGSIVSTSLILGASPASAQDPHRAFSDDSWWNTPLPSSAPVHPSSADMIQWLQQDNGADHIRLAGTGSSGEWGMPIYWADADDPVYRVVATRYTLPPEFASLRIPPEVIPDPTSDAALTIYDLEAGYVSKLQKAVYDPVTDTWSAGGGAVYYLASNGLHGRLPESDEARNYGHRGVPPSTYAVRWDEIQAGRIDHVLKIAVNTTRAENVWPMTGHEDGTTAVNAPPEGTRIRIKPSVDLSSLGLSGASLTVARALQRYGAVIGDQSGGNVVLKVENTVAEGRGWLWQNVLGGGSLSAIPLDSYEVIEHGYQPDPNLLERVLDRLPVLDPEVEPGRPHRSGLRSEGGRPFLR